MAPLASPVQPNATQDLPVEPATLYPEPDGFFGRRAMKRRAKLLERIAPALRRALAPGETIRFATRGTRVFWGEYMFAGAAAQYHNMSAGLQALVKGDRAAAGPPSTARWRSSTA